MRVRLLGMTVAAVSLGVQAPAVFAHHSVVATHDTTRVISIAGSVTKIDWMNPHVWIHLNVKKPNGDVVTERIEIGAPGHLIAKGFNMNRLKVGDGVTLDVWMPKDTLKLKENLPNGRTLTLPDGRRFDVGDQWPMR